MDNMMEVCSSLKGEFSARIHLTLVLYQKTKKDDIMSYLIGLPQKDMKTA